MQSLLAPNVRMAIAGRAVIFLDIANDRYFALPPEADTIGAKLAAGTALTPADQRTIGDLLGIDPDLLISGMVDPARRIDPAVTLETNDEPMSRLADMRALAAILTMRSRLAAGGLRAGLRRVARRRRVPLAPSFDRLAHIAGAHRRANRWYSVHANCLARATALSAMLSGAGIANDLVLGVKSLPFGAHSWVQIGDMVINDRPERVLPFTPILIL